MDNEQGCPSVSVETQRLRLTVRRDNGEYEIHHIPTGRVWSGPKGRLCSLTLAPNDGRLESPQKPFRVHYCRLCEPRFLTYRKTGLAPTARSAKSSAGAMDIAVQLLSTASN